MIGDLDGRDFYEPNAPLLQTAAQSGREAGMRYSSVRLRSLRLAIKRAMDVSLSLAGLIVLAPMLLALAVVIKATSAGPVLFWQDRVGQNGKTFRLCKFRTMYSNCCDASGVQQAMPGDPRVTPLGSVLRRHSLDELPQLLNVLRGQMSLVGPRAQVADMRVCGVLYQSVIGNYHLRHQMRPGITGSAQVRGLRGPVLDFEHASQRIEADLDYIENFTITLDVWILVRTVIQELARGSGV